MTVQGIAPTGKNPFGLAPVNKAKTKVDGTLDPGFASLLAAMVFPGAVPAPGLMLTAEGGEAQASPEGGPLLPVLSMGGPGGATPPVETPPANIGQLVSAVQSAQDQLQAASAAGNGPVTVASLITEAAPAPVEQTQVTPPPVNLAEPQAPEGEVPLPVQLAADVPTPAPVETAPVEPEQLEPALPPVPPQGEATGKEHAHKENDHQSNPDLTRGLDRAAAVSEAREHGPVDAPNPDKFAIPPAPATRPTDPPPVTPAAEPDLPPSLEALQTGRHEPGRLMEAISRSVGSTRDGNYTVTLRLHPETLGEVRLQLHLSGRQVHTVMEVASPEARQALESRGDQLRQSLNEAGLTLSGFEVSTGQNRQSARERREAFADQLRGQIQVEGRRTQPVAATPVGAIERIRNAGRRSGRFDTMA